MSNKMKLNARKIGTPCPITFPHKHKTTKDYLLRPYRLNDVHGGDELEGYEYGDLVYYLAKIVDGRYQIEEEIGNAIHEPLWNRRPWHMEATDLYLVAYNQVYDEVLYHIPMSVAHYIIQAK